MRQMAFLKALGLEYKIQMVDQRALGLESLKVRTTLSDSRNLSVTQMEFLKAMVTLRDSTMALCLVSAKWMVELRLKDSQRVAESAKQTQKELL